MQQSGESSPDHGHGGPERGGRPPDSDKGPPGMLGGPERPSRLLLIRWRTCRRRSAPPTRSRGARRRPEPMAWASTASMRSASTSARARTGELPLHPCHCSGHRGRRALARRARRRLSGRGWDSPLPCLASDQHQRSALGARASLGRGTSAGSLAFLVTRPLKFELQRREVVVDAALNRTPCELRHESCKAGQL